MKNSPGSMIGGIGFTTWVRALQFSRTIAMTSSTWASSTPTHHGRVRLLEEAARRVQPRGPVLALQQGVDEDARVLVVDDGHDELHRGEHSRPASGDRAARRAGGCTMPTRHDRRDGRRRTDRPHRGRNARGGLVSEPAEAGSRAAQPSSRPAPRRSRERTTWTRALAVIVEAGAAATGARDRPRCSRRTRTATRLELLLTLGMTDEQVAGFETDGGRRPGPPDPPGGARPDRARSAGRGSAGDGAPMTGRGPAAGRRGQRQRRGVRRRAVRSAGRATHEVDAAEETLLVAVADLAAAAIATFRTSSMATERAEWFERVAHTDPLTGLSNARTLGRVLELEVARAQRQGTEVSVALFDVDAFTRAQRGGRVAGRRPGPAPGRERCSRTRVRLVDTVARTGGDEFVLVAPGSAGVTVAPPGARRDRGPRGDRGPPGQRQRRRSPASRRTARTRSRCSRPPRAAVARASGRQRVDRRGGRRAQPPGRAPAVRAGLQPGGVARRGPAGHDRARRRLVAGVGLERERHHGARRGVRRRARSRARSRPIRREVAHRDRRRVRADRPRRVDLRAGGRRQPAQRELHRAVGADHPEARTPTRRPAGDQRGHAAGLARRGRAPARRRSGRPGRRQRSLRSASSSRRARPRRSRRPRRASEREPAGAARARGRGAGAARGRRDGARRWRAPAPGVVPSARGRSPHAAPPSTGGGPRRGRPRRRPAGAP